MKYKVNHRIKSRTYRPGSSYDLSYWDTHESVIRILNIVSYFAVYTLDETHEEQGGKF